jgi:hypothetical protein
MFKKVQKYLLINHPLLWNTKVVPAVSIALLLHILFFFIGYFDGTVNFASENQYDDGIGSGIVIFFSILVTLMFFVMWLVYYARNNAYKSFYRLTSAALYKEWLIIFLICLLNITYSVTYVTGKTLKIRSYYSKEEIEKRCETISMASIFIVGSYDHQGPEGDTLSSVLYKRQRYSQNSLINKSMEYFEINSGKHLESRVKTWMQDDNQQAIKKLMADYFAIVREHHLETNLTAEKWFELTYNYPSFIKYEEVGRTSKKYLGTDKNDYVVEAASNSYTYNLPQNALFANYQKFSKSWDQPLIEGDTALVLLYLSLALAMLLFAFKVTDRRNWLIALVGLGVLWILTGIFAAIFDSTYVFIGFWMLAIMAIIAHFLVVVNKNRSKELSGISLNLMLWSFGAFLPILYELITKLFDYPKTVRVGDNLKYVNTPMHDWLEANDSVFAGINVVIIILAMYLIAIYIKRWKGIAEN